ncbi:dual specificity tyrosine-phosphorylation-regulated kinase 4-like [Conger conger]|uniref:dual specificity tyrosine-phosphorylation-regulated kinase 4-like n=1 Tax=Conger conger TaxID=82655 RepID=UPI002A59FBAD|nr:dual specificity tyrosine-phosphorylation-regulated kinase 4-like [Conger conger]
MEEVDTNSSSLFQEEILVPPKYNILLDLKKKMEERNQQMDQTPTDLNTVAEVQVPGDQVTEKLSNPKLLHTTLSILPEIRKMVVERKCRIDQQESSKVSISLRTVEAEAKSVPKNLNQERVRKGLPLSPAVALQYFQKHLTSLEQREILDFPEIWYLGLGAEKKDPQEMAEYSEDSNSNSDHDDESGIYVPVLHDHIAYRYEILENLGQGSFGLVLKCLDHKIKELVALKVIHDMESANNRALKELEILDAVRREDKENQYNVIHMKEYMTFRKHLCITFELQGMDLYELMKENSFKGFSMSQTRHYATALVNSLQMLHRKKIVHCDLKPENILLSERRHGNIKLADFGCSFYEHQEGCTYVQTRFYRAPEVILGIPYGTAIDMWSLGCILAELYTGYPLFSGTNEVDQLACIMEVLGTPPDYIVRMSPRRKVFFEEKGNANNHTDSKGQTACLAKRPNSKDLASALRSRDLLFVDFVTRCLTWDSAQRMTAEEAAWHQWLQKPRTWP